MGRWSQAPRRFAIGTTSRPGHPAPCKTKPILRWGASTLLLAILWGGWAARPAVGDELDNQIKILLPQLEDAHVKIADRERLAMEIATNLDAAARGAPTVEARRARWVEAAEVLDRFQGRNPGHPEERAFALQSAVYRWAEAQTWAAQAEANPADPAPRDRAIEALDAALARLEPLLASKAKPDDSFLQGVRYRLARALADRATLVEGGAKAARRRALALLEPPIREPAFRGFALLLRAELLTKLGELDAAEAELDASEKAEPAPTASERLTARVDLLLARGRFDDALKAAEGATAVEEPTRRRLAFGVALARFQDLPKGPARSKVEADLFHRAEALRESGGGEARSSLAALARVVEEPGPGLGPDSWDALAEGQSLLGHPGRAGTLAATAAEKAQALGHRERANRLRQRAAAFFFQDEAFGRAEALLTRVFDDPQAGDLRPKAGLLRILARAKLLEEGRGGEAASSYLQALEAQIREFPKDEGANEARWRLGRARLAAGDRERAVDLWSDIPRGSPRWLGARLAVLDLLEDDLEAPLLNEDMAAAHRVMEEAQRLLDRTSTEAGDGPEHAEVDLRRALLDLTPHVGRPDAALAACDRLVRSSGREALRDRARRLRIIALAQLGRSVDAEREARAESTTARPEELFEILRRLDRAAWASESDLARRRMGGILRTLLAPILAKPGDFPPARVAEAAIRLARARHYGGDQDGARKTLLDAKIALVTLDDRLLSDLADIAAELEAQDVAIDAYRLLARHRHAGSIPWLAARYGQALAYSRADRPKEARQLIDGTAILYPDLGGGGLRNKFERLRGRLSGGGSR